MDIEQLAGTKLGNYEIERLLPKFYRRRAISARIALELKN
jgi:hypothetical protein